MDNIKEGTKVHITCLDGEEVEATLVRDLNWCPTWARLLVRGYHCVIPHERMASVVAVENER